jgi:putative thioredoxin
MSGSDNPYNASLGGQMSGTVNMGAPAVGGSYITDTTTATFARDVLEESRHQPVLVDFWAPWCGPCKQLTPTLEKVINEGRGRVKLVKMNIDDHPSIAGQLGIQSIPAVIAFVNGRPADGFMGAVPESQVREFIDRLVGPDNGSEGDDAAQIASILDEAAALLANDDINGAAELFGAVLQADPENAKALAGMAECMIAAGQSDRARQALSDLPDTLAQDAGILAVVKKLDQIDEARKLGDPAALERALAVNPDDHEARISLAKILNVQGKRDDAAEHLLTVMRRDRTFDDDGARRQRLQFFDVWGFKDPATVTARRKLSSIIFS